MPLLVLIALLLPSTLRASPHVLEYIYVEANEGGASGGHAAIRFDDHTFHFQQHAPGVVRLHRDDSGRFRYRYRVLENRPLHVSRIPASDETFELLRGYFSRRYLLEMREFDALAALGEERALLQLWQARQRQPAGHTAQLQALQIPALGFFLPDCGRAEDTDLNECGPGEADDALVALRQRIEAVYGDDFVPRRSRELRAELEGIGPPADGAIEAQGQHATFTYSFARRYTDVTVNLMALQVLQEAPMLRAGTYAIPTADAFVLTADEQAALRGFAKTLENDLVALAQSSRPDWGFAFVIGMARLVALEKSLALGRLVFLDAFPPEQVVLSRAQLEPQRDLLPGLRDEAGAEFEQARARLHQQPPIGEADYAQIEATANRLAELQQAVAGGDHLRIFDGMLLPSRPAHRADIVLPRMSAVTMTAALSDTTAREEVYERALHEKYRYDLITRNCVSEIFQGIETALTSDSSAGPGAPTDVDAESTRRLGGYIQPGARLSFIPFVSSHAVRTSYQVDETEELVSYRQARVRDMYDRENGTLVYLRESNVLTSTIYERRAAADSIFLFFTDDVFFARPLLGAANLVTGLVGGIVGVALAPFDRGETVRAGFKGALFSVPELAFFNVRKGSFTYVPQARVPTSAFP